MILVEKLKYYLAQNNTIRQTLFKNTFWLSIAEFFKNGVRFLIQILLARELGATGFGLFSFALSFAAIFAFLADFGFPTLILRNVARDKSQAKKYFSNILFVKTILGIITFLLIVFSVQLISLEESTKILIYLAGISVIINTFSEFFRAFFRAFEKMQWEAASKIFEGLLLALVIGFLIAKRGADLKEIFYGYIAVGIIVLILNSVILAKRFLRERLFKKYSLDFKEIKSILKESLPLVFSAVFISIYYYIDQIMIGVISTKTELGYYSAAQRIVYGLSMFYMIALIVFSPKIAYFFKKDTKQLSLLLKKMNKAMIAIAVPMGIGGTILAPEIINFIFGSEYTRAILAFQILIWSQVIVFINACYGNTLVMCNKQNKFLYGVAMGSVINIILNFTLIAKFSLYGAAAATVITQFLVFIYMYFALSKEVVKIKFYKYLKKPLLASFLMLAVLIFLKTIFSVFILIPVGIIFYFLLLFKVFRFR
ncbi:MAG: oligosaccharide flippase family protein [Xanthomonadaceae bacterium]|nr:oligosaccharide flippase family protein [Rhodospirillaceae bacterium]NIA17632.1 oligosaccharide flippase family protein [Xanthomonadaceae bacterium]